MENRICEYKNCGKSFNVSRETKIYCCVKCQRNAAKYRSREMNAYRKEKQRVNKILDQVRAWEAIDNNDKEKEQILALYKKIYG